MFSLLSNQIFHENILILVIIMMALVSLTQYMIVRKISLSHTTVNSEQRIRHELNHKDIFFPFIEAFSIVPAPSLFVLFVCILKISSP